MRQERLYFFQFPAPFPTFVSEPPTHSDTSEPGSTEPKNESKRVSFSADTKPPAAVPEDVDKEKPPAHVDGVIGQLEIYQSGAVKMRLADGILLDVSALFHMISKFLDMSCTGNCRDATIVPAASRSCRSLE